MFSENIGKIVGTFIHIDVYPSYVEYNKHHSPQMQDAWNNAEHSIEVELNNFINITSLPIFHKPNEDNLYCCPGHTLIYQIESPMK